MTEHVVTTEQVRRLLERKRRSQARAKARPLSADHSGDMALHAMRLARLEAEIEVLRDLLAGECATTTTTKENHS